MDMSPVGPTSGACALVYGIGLAATGAVTERWTCAAMAESRASAAATAAAIAEGGASTPSIVRLLGPSCLRATLGAGAISVGDASGLGSDGVAMASVGPVGFTGLGALGVASALASGAMPAGGKPGNAMPIMVFMGSLRGLMGSGSGSDAAGAVGSGAGGAGSGGAGSGAVAADSGAAGATCGAASDAVSIVFMI